MKPPSAHVRGVVARAVAVASLAPAGPVQVNAPFREPLIPMGPLGAPRDRPGPEQTTTAMSGVRRLTEADVADLAARLAAARRGVIVCGPLDRPGFAEAVAGLAAATGFPIIADALSNVRFGGHDRTAVIARADALLRAPSFAADHTPDLVLRFGGTPTSRALLEWIAAERREADRRRRRWLDRPGRAARHDGRRRAGAARFGARRRGGARRRSGPRRLAGLVACRGRHRRDRRPSAWLDRLEEPFEGQVFDVLGACLPEGTILLAGNSMPVRDMEAFLGSGARALRCLGNRGANGIDGLVSTALGMAAVSEGPVVAVVGDIAFLHDLNALVAARRHRLSATIVLVNNDGGGIFSFLPQASAERPEVGLPEHFEELFGTPHGLDLGPLVRALGAEHAAVGPRDLAVAVQGSLGRPGVQVLEVRTDRTRDVELHRELQPMPWHGRRSGPGSLDDAARSDGRGARAAHLGQRSVGPPRCTASRAPRPAGSDLATASGEAASRHRP